MDTTSFRIASDPKDYKNIALGFLKTHPTVYRDGVDYIFNGKHYYRCDELNLIVKRYLMGNGLSYINSATNEVISCLRSLARYPQTKHKQVPFWIRGERSTDVLIFNNGILDLTTLELTPHTADLFCPYGLPFDYDPAATCPVWLEALKQPFEGDEQRINLLQEWFGYCLSGDTRQQVFMCCFGPPGSMKGTVAYILERMIGIENATGFDLRSLTSRFGSGVLVNKKVALVDEVELTGVKDRSAIVEKLKSIVGEGLVDVEYKMSNNHHSVKLPSRFHITANSMPDLKDPSGALLRRLLLLPIHRAVPHDKVDINLKEKLEAELSGIANWSLIGLKRVRSTRRFTPPDAAKDHVEKFIEDSSAALGFLRDCCELQDSFHPGNLQVPTFTAKDEWWTKKSDVTEKAKKWYEEHSKEFSEQWFYRDLCSLVPLCRTKRRRATGGSLFQAVTGVKINNP